MTSYPKVAIIIPAYNSAQTIREAMETVAAQTFRDYSIILIDDGSTDGTHDAAKASGVEFKYIYQENQGPAAARNRGIRECNTPYLAFLDSDDVWPEDKLERQYRSLLEEPDLLITVGRLRKFRVNVKGERVLSHPLFGFTFGCGLYRREIFDQVGFIDETFRGPGEDIDWYWRVKELNIPHRETENVVLHQRIREGSLTSQRRVVEKTFLQALKKNMDRRREQTGSASK